MSRRGATLVFGWLAATHLGMAHGDSQLWIEPGVGVAAARRVDVGVTAEVRLDQDVSRFAAFLPEVTGRYRATRWLRIGGGYRFEYERDSMGELVSRSRVSADARFHIDSPLLRLAYRLMFVEQFRPTASKPHRTVLRNRVDVGYRLAGAWKPRASIEVFHMLDDLDKTGYERTRFTVGTAHEAGDREVEVFLRVEVHADPAEPNDAILGLGFHHEL